MVTRKESGDDKCEKKYTQLHKRHDANELPGRNEMTGPLIFASK